MLHFIAQQCVILTTLALAVLPAAAAGAADTVNLTPKFEPGQIMRISIDFEAGGNQLIRTVAPVADKKAAPGSDEKQLPASVVASLQYDERRLTSLRNEAVRPGTQLAVRYYDRAEETIKVDTTGVAPRLADSRRLIVVEQAANRPTLYSPSGPLPRDELDLIDCIGSSAVMEQLLPTKPVAQGESWASDPAVMGAWLTLDTVSVCEVSSLLEEFNAAFAKVRVVGVIHGTADGTPTQQEIRAVYLFDRRLGRITRVNIAAREKRSIGGATPGLDATAKMQMKIEPVSSSPHLTEAAVNSAVAAKSRHPAADILCDQPTLGFRMVHDRGWYITSQSRETMTLRRIDQGDVVAQCSITVLPPKGAGRQTSLDQFQKDIIYSLGQNFGELARARQWTNSRGHFCYEVVARGLVEEVPIEWHYYLVAQESGHRITLATTTERPMLERLGQSDLVLVEAMELFQPTPQTTAQAPASTNKK